MQVSQRVGHRKGVKRAEGWHGLGMRQQQIFRFLFLFLFIFTFCLHHLRALFALCFQLVFIIIFFWRRFFIVFFYAKMKLSEFWVGRKNVISEKKEAAVCCAGKCESALQKQTQPSCMPKSRLRKSVLHNDTKCSACCYCCFRRHTHKLVHNTPAHPLTCVCVCVPLP